MVFWVLANIIRICQFVDRNVSTRRSLIPFPCYRFTPSLVIYGMICVSAGGGSDLRLWTVNGDLVGHVHCREIICSVAFSNQPEGVSINVIAGGLENGIVR